MGKIPHLAGLWLKTISIPNYLWTLTKWELGFYVDGKSTTQVLKHEKQDLDNSGILPFGPPPRPSARW